MFGIELSPYDSRRTVPQRTCCIRIRSYSPATATPVLMGQPTADLEKTNGYTLACARQYGLPAMFCTSYDMLAETVRRALAEDGYAGLKPYLNNAPASVPPDERQIYDFLPRAHLEVADGLGTAVILHIARPGRLKNPLNVAQLMEIEREYPNVNLIVAHIGRAYEDLPSEAEYKEALANLDTCGWKVDYGVSHCCPTSIADIIGQGQFQPDALTDFFEGIKDRLDFRYWLFGHYHDNRIIGMKYILLYERIIDLD